MTERPRIKGMQDPKLEVGRTGSKNKTTPTSPEDISPRALNYKRLVDTAVWATMRLESCQGDESLPRFGYAKETLATVRDETKRFGFDPEGMDLAVKQKIEQIKETEKRERRSKPNYDRQATLGDVPPTTVFERGDNGN